MSYENGFEDALELCWNEAQEVENKEALIERIEYFIRLVKESKMDKVKQMIGVLRT